VLLDQASIESGKSDIYHQLGYIKNNQGDYEKSMKRYFRQIIHHRLGIFKYGKISDDTFILRKKHLT
jgi:hypothetical protein